MQPARVSLPDRYRMTGHVASGGMAAVYAAHDELLGRDVAVKVLAEHLGEDPSAKLRFQREARAAAGLSSHPHVVTIYDVGEHQGRSFIVMELLENGSLAAVLRSGRRVDQATTVGWLRDTAGALDAAHTAGIVHRDIKPANLLLDARGGLAIADFGIARIAQEDGFTMTGQVLGTAAYLSPEQALGEPATAASDRYALAVVAFELLTGRRPFTNEHFAAQARAHIEDEPPRASSIRPELPAAVDAIFDRGLAKDPGDRWPSASAFVDALEDALDARVPLAAAAPDSDPTVAMVAPPPPPPTPAPPRRRSGPAEPPEERTADGVWPVAAPARRSRAPLAVGAVVLALLGGGAAYAALAAGGDDDPTRSTRGTQASRQEASTPTPTPTAEATATPSPTATTAPEATPTPTPTATSTPSPTPAPSGGGGGNASQLNDDGFARYQAGDYAGAIAPLTRAVEACGTSKELDPCGYALYNLGSSLHRAGRSAEGIQFLERRLADFDFRNSVVQRELRAARRGAG